MRLIKYCSRLKCVRAYLCKDIDKSWLVSFALSWFSRSTAGVLRRAGLVREAFYQSCVGGAFNILELGMPLLKLFSSFSVFDSTIGRGRSDFFSMGLVCLGCTAEFD